MPVLWMGPGFTKLWLVKPKGWWKHLNSWTLQEGKLGVSYVGVEGPISWSNLIPLSNLRQPAMQAMPNCSDFRCGGETRCKLVHHKRSEFSFGQLWKKKQPPTQCALVGIATIGPMKKTWRNDDKKPWYPWSTLKHWCTKLGPPFSYVVVSTQSEGYAPQMGCSSSTGVNNGEHFHLEVFEKTIGSPRYH